MLLGVDVVATVSSSMLQGAVLCEGLPPGRLVRSLEGSGGCDPAALVTGVSVLEAWGALCKGFPPARFRVLDAAVRLEALSSCHGDSSSFPSNRQSGPRPHP